VVKSPSVSSGPTFLPVPVCEQTPSKMRMRPSWLEFENSSLNSGGFESVRAIQIHDRDSKLNFSAPLFPTIIIGIT